MDGLAAVIVLAMAGGAFYVVHSRASAGPLTCAQQYTAWKNGPANHDGKQLEAAAASLSADGKTEDIAAMDADLKTLGADAAALKAYPMPACADPAGYWEQYLGQMKAAGDNAGTASGLGGVILAEAPLKQVPADPVQAHRRAGEDGRRQGVLAAESLAQRGRDPHRPDKRPPVTSDRGSLAVLRVSLAPTARARSRSDSARSAEP